MHENIKKFFLDGIVGDDENLVQSKEFLIKNLEDQMRDNGFVPVLDMDPQFTLSYNVEKDYYDFNLSIYGVKVGRQQSWDVAGIMNGKTLTRSTVPVR